MVFISSEGGDRDFLYEVHPDWHGIGADLTEQILSFLEHSSLPKSGKANLIAGLNRTLNVLGSAMYHLRNYKALEQDRFEFLENSVPAGKSSQPERLVIIPDLQCELQAFLMQVHRSFNTLPELMKPILAVSKGISFGESGENVLDVLQEILISDIADSRKHPIEKLVRLVEQDREFSNPPRGKKKPWLRFLADFRKHAMNDEQPALAAFRVVGSVEEKTIEVRRPMYNVGLSLGGLLEKIWEAAVDFHRDFYSLMVFWTLKPRFSFTMLPEEKQAGGSKWNVVSSTQ
jgi:hypothetical protein